MVLNDRSDPSIGRAINGRKQPYRSAVPAAAMHIARPFRPFDKTIHTSTSVQIAAQLPIYRNTSAVIPHHPAEDCEVEKH